MEQYLIDEFMDDPTAFFDLHADERLGGGSYSAVMDSDIENVVIKKTHTPDEDFWYWYAAYCMSQRELKPWMPRIYAVHLDKDAEYGYALMEKLETQFSDDDTKRIYTSGYASNFVEGHLTHETGEIASVGVPINEIREFLECAVAFFPDVYFDAHDENWMIRDKKQHVLMDPLNEHGFPSEELRDSIKFAAKEIPNFWVW